MGARGQPTLSKCGAGSTPTTGPVRSTSCPDQPGRHGRLRPGAGGSGGGRFRAVVAVVEQGGVLAKVWGRGDGTTSRQEADRSDARDCRSLPASDWVRGRASSLGRALHRLRQREGTSARREGESIGWKPLTLQNAEGHGLRSDTLQASIKAGRTQQR